MSWPRRWARKGVGSSQKFGNKRVTKDGLSFGSKLESSVDDLLLLREKAGEIKIIRRQQHIHFYFGETKLCEYWPDFTCLDLKTNEVFWVEAKGKSDNADWKIKLNLWRGGGPGRLEIYGGNYRRPFLVESVNPCERCGLVREAQVFGKLEAS